VTKISEIPENLTENFNKLFEVMLKRGIYLAPNAYEVGFVSLAHDDKVLEDLKNRLK
jgi:glutamate-1-semialdehyde 2,1-aminomutase